MRRNRGRKNEANAWGALKAEPRSKPSWECSLSHASKIVLATWTHLLGIGKLLGWRHSCWCVWTLSILYLIYVSPSIHRQMLRQVKVFSIPEVGNIVLEIPAGLKTVTHRGLGCPHVPVFPMSWLKRVGAATFLLAMDPERTMQRKTSNALANPSVRSPHIYWATTMCFHIALRAGDKVYKWSTRDSHIHAVYFLVCVGWGEMLTR